MIFLPISMPSSTSPRSIAPPSPEASARRSRSRASPSTLSCVLFRMNPAGTRRIRCAASVVQSKVEISGFFLSSRAMSFASRCRAAAWSWLRGVPGCRRDQRRRLDIQRRSGLFLDHLPGEFERDRVELHHARALFDTRLHAAPLIGVLHGPEAFPRVLRPAQLASVVGGLLFETALGRRNLLDHLLRDHLEVRGAADGALARRRSAWRRRRTTCTSTRGRTSPARAQPLRPAPWWRPTRSSA